MTATRIALSRPIVLHGQTIGHVNLKEPTGQAFIDLGEPRVMVHMINGGGYYVEQPETIKAYLETCVDHELGADLVKLMSLTDATRVKRALFDFFAAASATPIAPPSPTSSTA
jgi:hypothetical protein